MSRQGLPVRTTHNTASTKPRLFSPLPPGSPGLPRQCASICPRQCASICAHWASVSTSRSIVSLIHTLTRANNPDSQQALGLVEVQGFAPGGGVIQTPQGVWHGPLCSDRRPMGEDGAALPGQADRSRPDRNGWAVVPGGGAVDCPHEQALA